MTDLKNRSQGENRRNDGMADPIMQAGGIIINQNDLYIIISQSGETAGTLAAMKMAKKEGAKIPAITT